MQSETQATETVPTTEVTPETKPAEQQFDQNLPEVQAAMYLRTAIPSFRHKLEKLNRSAAKRLLSAIIESPLEKETPNFTSPEEEDLFMMGLTISNAKFILFNVSLKDQELTKNIEEESKNAAEAANVAEATQGESNG